MAANETPLSLDLDDLLPSHHTHASTDAGATAAEKSRVAGFIAHDDGTAVDPEHNDIAGLKQQALDFELPADAADDEPPLTLSEAGAAQPRVDVPEKDSRPVTAKTSEATEPTHHYRIGDVEVHDVALLPEADAEQLALDIPVLPPLARNTGRAHQESAKPQSTSKAHEGVKNQDEYIQKTLLS